MIRVDRAPMAANDNSKPRPWTRDGKQLELFPNRAWTDPDEVWGDHVIAALEHVLARKQANGELPPAPVPPPRCGLLRQHLERAIAAIRRKHPEYYYKIID